MHQGVTTGAPAGPAKVFFKCKTKIGLYVWYGREQSAQTVSEVYLKPRGYEMPALRLKFNFAQTKGQSTVPILDGSLVAN